MPRIATIPRGLENAPLTVAVARRHGLEEWRLRTRAWRRVAPATYVPASVADTPALKVDIASRRLPTSGAFSGYTAAWLHGVPVPGFEPIEVTVAAPTSVSSRAGMIVRRRAMKIEDFDRAGGHRVTSVTRTLRDLCVRLSLTEGVVLVDELMDAPELRRILPHAEALAESPGETRLRMVVVLGGLPRPTAQVTIRDRWGRAIGRPDLYYREQGLGLEYDGHVHNESLAADNRRQNRLLQAGVRLLRFTAGDVLGSPSAVVAAVRTELARQ